MCGFCSRRSFLTGALATAAAVAAPAVGRAAGSGGCLIEEVEVAGVDITIGTTRYEVRSSSGNPSLDRAMIAELKRMLEVFPVNPGFKFIVDRRPNAFATTGTVVQGTNGTMLFGINLVRQEIENSSDGGVAVAGIAAHEMAHIYQYGTRWRRDLDGPTVAKIELQADYLSGFYMGRRRDFSAGRLETYATSLFNKGDFDFNDRGHHGTPDQRVEAMMRGYRSATQGLDLRAAAKQGADYVRSI